MRVLQKSDKNLFDMVIKTMYETDKDLSCRCRETSEGGLVKLYEKREGRR